MTKTILLIVALIIGYMIFSQYEQEKMVSQTEQREEHIMEKQQQFMKQSQDMSQQLQQDLDERMQE